MTSLRRRLSLGVGLTLVVLLSAQWWVAGRLLQNLTERYVASRLRHDVESVLAAVQYQNGQLQIQNLTLGPVYQRPFSGHYYIVAADAQVLRSRSLWDESLGPTPPVAIGAQRVYHRQGPQRQPLLIVTAGFRLSGRPLRITVAEDLSPLKGELRVFQIGYGIMSAVVLLLLVIAQMLAVSRGLRPLRRMQVEVRRLERGEVGRLATEVPDEIVPLVWEINRLLELTERRLDRSRHALGNLAHALKTPLSLLTRLSEDSRRTMDDQTREQLRNETGHIRALVDRELRRARLAGGPAPGQWFAPKQDIPDLVRVIQGIYAEKQLTIDQRINADRIPVDREDMLELMGNLLDNAAKWAHSRIRIVVNSEPDVLLVVEDDGPGCTDTETLRKRGRRLDESTPGAGLGLSIVESIVQDYRGTLELDRSPELGGLRASIRLPANLRYDIPQ